MARFAPDGQTVVYSAAWEGNPVEVFAARPESPESRLLGLARTEILGISARGEMAVSLGPHLSGPYTSIGTLAQLPLAGGAPREMLEEVQWADWSPDGSNLLVVRVAGGRNRLEFPIGKVLFESGGWISHPRISPRGDMVAFLDHPQPGDDGGLVAVVGLDGHKRSLSSRQISTQGLAWSPGAEEIWFTATRQGSARAIYAINLWGRERLVARMPGTLTIQDIYKDGRVLLARDSWRRELKGLAPGETKERDLSWLDYSYPADLSPDGGTLLFDEEGEGGGWTYAVYLRKIDGSPAIRLGPGQATALSPDGKWVISLPSGSPAQFILLPTKAGESRPLTNDTINHVWARCFPDSKRFVFSGNEPDRGVRLFVQDMTDGKAKPFSPEGTSAFSISLSPDGRVVAAIGPDQKGYLYPVAGGEPRLIPGLESGEEPIIWGPENQSLFVYRPGQLPAKIYRLNVGNGERTLWKQLMPSDPAGVNHIGPILLSSDGKTYVYGYHRTLTDLYLVEGLK
jgi:Tol biopolymer transport system component